MNNVSRWSPPPPPVGTQSGQWVWNGTSWQCDSDDFPTFGPPGCPPPSFPPAGCPPWFPPPQGQPPWYPGANAGVSFGQTAPVNPVRGHFWWNGSSLMMFDGAAWVVVGGAPGGTTPPQTTAPANPVPGQQWFNGTTLFVWDGNAWIPVSQTQTFIQATAPSSPKPGDTWWDGTQFRIWSGSAWQLVGPGATVGPVPTTTIEFAITLPTSVATPGSSQFGIVPFTATPLTDLLSAWDPITHKYQPNRPGVYNFMFRSAPNGGGGLAIVKNDPGTFTDASFTSDIVVATASVTATSWINCSGLTQMNGSTDYVRAWAWSVSASLFPCGSNPVFTGTVLP
jgi:diadenosine tetraphosphatase ApaH/serine/threonine PP2A family protein phosphatase